MIVTNRNNKIIILDNNLNNKLIILGRIKTLRIVLLRTGGFSFARDNSGSNPGQSLSLPLLSRQRRMGIRQIPSCCCLGVSG